MTLADSDARCGDVPAGGTVALAPTAASFHSLYDTARLAALEHLTHWEHLVWDPTDSA